MRHQAGAPHSKDGLTGGGGLSPCADSVLPRVQPDAGPWAAISQEQWLWPPAALRSGPRMVLPCGLGKQVLSS